MLPDSTRSSGRVLSGGHAEDADSSDNMARDIEFDAKRHALYFQQKKPPALPLKTYWVAAIPGNRLY